MSIQFGNQGLDSIWNSIQYVSERLVGDFIGSLPNMLVALILLIVGWVIALAIAGILKKALELAKFEKFLAIHKVEDSLGKVRLSDALVQTAKYYVILIFLQEAVLSLNLGSLSFIIGKIVLFGPSLIGSIVIVIIAAIIGELIREKIFEVHNKELYMRTLGNGAKYLFVFMGAVVALETLGFNTAIVKDTFITIIQALGLAFGLAVGLAFGFGGQEAAKAWIKEGRKKFHI